MFMALDGNAMSALCACASEGCRPGTMVHLSDLDSLI